MWSLLSLLISILLLSTHQTLSLSTTPPTTTSKKSPVNRLTFLKNSILPSLLILTNNPLQAQAIGGPKPNLEGTKEDPDYKNCLAINLYECTKPKGDEQRTRKECLPECKVKCAKTKEQLLLGSPVKK